MIGEVPSTMKIVCISQARMGSSRLPGKVLRKAHGQTFLQIQLARLGKCQELSQIVVATSLDPGDDAIEELCRALNVSCFRGSENDVLDRFYQAARHFEADVIVRVTADCPLVDPALIDDMLRDFKRSPVDYLCNVCPPTYPDGLDVEIFTLRALAQAWEHFGIGAEREHVTHYIRNSSALVNETLFSARNIAHSEDLSDLRITLDTAEDLALITHLIEELGPEASWLRYANLLRQDPTLRSLNAKHVRNSSYTQQVKEQSDLQLRQIPRSFQKSTSFLAEVSRFIPLGSQTFSKSKVQYPEGAAPLFLTRGEGSKVWDLDGNSYVDFSNSLMAITLGYCDPDINAAVAEQLKNGSILSLPHPLEYEVAKLICDLVPCAEMVRFGKNGSDATAAAVRLARAYTGRDHVLVCGYHGWQDWYIGSTTRNLGVPGAVRDLTHPFPYNDIGALERLCAEFKGQVAAIVMEPVNVTPPRDNFLLQIRDLATREKIVLVFDEVITGFRFAPGGAQEFFGVTPDLATLGKGLSNGFPISAVVGRAEIMSLMEQIFFSTTFGGETLSLAAAKANLKKLKACAVVDRLFQTGQKIISGVSALIERHKLASNVTLQGYPPWSFVVFTPHENASVEQLKTLFIQEMAQSGILIAGTHNVTYAHSETDIDCLLSAHDRFLELASWALSRNKIAGLIKGKLLEPVFRIR